MSIVEKVISRDSGSKRPPRKPAPQVRKPLKDAAEGGAEQDSNVVKVTDVAERGMVSVLEDKDLFRAFRFLKRAVLAKIFGPTLSGADAGKVIMVTSAMPGAGKSFTAFNLATSIAQEQLINVVLIDADTVRHNLSNLLDQNYREGLQDILMTGDVSLGVLETDLPGLRFVPSGLTRDNATELLASEYMSDMLEHFNDPNTIVILDATPVTGQQRSRCAGSPCRSYPDRRRSRRDDRRRNRKYAADAVEVNGTGQLHHQQAAGNGRQEWPVLLLFVVLSRGGARSCAPC